MPAQFSVDFAYLAIVALMVIGLYGMLAKRNLMKKLIGLNIFQTAIILFFVAGSFKWGATVPILNGGIAPVDQAQYMNPLPHVMMLTAIVVAVAVIGVALAILVAIYRHYGDLDENAIMGGPEQ